MPNNIHFDSTKNNKIQVSKVRTLFFFNWLVGDFLFMSYIYIYIYIYINIYIYHHHHVVLVARISLTLSRHSSLSFIALNRSSGLHPVSSHSCWMYVRAGRPAFARPCVGVHKSTSLMSSSLLLQQCPACLVRLTWIVFRDRRQVTVQLVSCGVLPPGLYIYYISIFVSDIGLWYIFNSTNCIVSFTSPE